MGGCLCVCVCFRVFFCFARAPLSFEGNPPVFLGLLSDLFKVEALSGLNSETQPRSRKNWQPKEPDGWKAPSVGWF